MGVGVHYHTVPVDYPKTGQNGLSMTFSLNFEWIGVSLFRSQETHIKHDWPLAPVLRPILRLGLSTLFIQNSTIL